MTSNLLSITKNASNKLLKIIEANNSKGLLFYLNSGGCNGFEYKFKPINEFKNINNVYSKNNLNIEICNKSMLYLLGTKIDWNEDIMGQSFKFDNPIAKNACGCGSSFSPF